MRNYLLLFFVLLPALLLGQAQVPQGKWELRDKKGNPLVHLSFEKAETGLRAKVVAIPKGSIFEADGRCTTCVKKDPRHNKPLKGMWVLSGMQAAGTRWVQGDWLDLETGFSYVADLEITGPDEIIIHQMYGRMAKPKLLKKVR